MPVEVEAVNKPVELEPRTAPKHQALGEPADNPAVLVIGSINMDLVVRSDHMPRPGETILGREFIISPGGKGANQAVAAARLAGGCRMIGRVGDDLFGRRLIDTLDHAGVDTENVRVTEQCASGVAMISVDRSGENAITVVSGANGQLAPDDVTALEDIIAKAEVMVLQLEIPLPTVCRAIQLAHRHAVPVVLDPAPAPRCGLPSELFNVDIFTPNQTEAELLTGEPVGDLAEAKIVGAELVRRGASNVVVKMGEAGAVIVTMEGDVEHVPAFEVDVADTTAAGDAFTAALAVGRAQNMPLDDAVRMACAAGALATTQFGAQQSMPHRAAVDRMLRSRM